MTVCDERLTVHEEEADIAILRLGKHFLSDDICVASDRFDHLVQIRRLVAGDEEDACAPRCWEKSSTPIIQVSWPLPTAASASRTVVYSGFSVAMELMTKPILMGLLRRAMTTGGIHGFWTDRRPSRGDRGSEVARAARRARR